MIKMTREQMIAWLTLEGYRPMKDSRPNRSVSSWRGIRGGGHFFMQGRAGKDEVRDHFNTYPTDECEVMSDWADLSDALIEYATEHACK